MSSYCYDCQCEAKKVNEDEREIAGEKGFELYAHDICPECSKKFYSPAIPPWLEEGESE